MGQLTQEVLSEFFREGSVQSLKLHGVLETEDAKYLGAVGLSLHRPLFHSILGFNFSGVLSDSARFYSVPVSAAVEGQDGLVAVFRQFDSSKYQAGPEDVLAGWVPLDAAESLQTWIDEMNQLLRSLLELKHATASQ